MDNYTKITKDALRYLAYIIASCTPLCGTKQLKNEEYIMKLVQLGKDMIFKTFMAKLPQPSELYQQLYDFAKERKETYIDVKTICRFFSGERHIKKVLADIENAGLNRPDKIKLRMFFILIHTLIPLEIEKIEGDRYSGTYENGLVIFKIRNLMTFDGVRDKVKKGKITFSHYGSIICVPSGRFSTKIIEEIREEQAGIEEFLDAAEYFSENGGIDFNKAKWLRDAAETVAKKYGL
jgi:hypothetical protein